MISFIIRTIFKMFDINIISQVSQSMKMLKNKILKCSYKKKIHYFTLICTNKSIIIIRKIC